MTTLQNDRFLRAIRKQPIDCTPIWMMRQAGRYLPEYRALRQKAGHFMVMCQTPELACEITLQPLQRFDLDAAIIFSDILTIPDAMGLGLNFVAGEGPTFERPITTAMDVERLGVPDPESDLRYVADAISLTKRELAGRVPLLGFSGSPWTLATYMVEGGSSKAFTVIKAMLYREPALLERLLAVLTESVIAYLEMQIAAGADALMLFDTWGGVLTTHDYQRYSLAYMQQIVTRLQAKHRDIPLILFTKQGNLWLEMIAATGCDGVGLDWTIDIADAKQRIGDKVALQGNMDPSVLYAPPQRIEQEVETILQGFGHGSGHVFNLGHGIHQDVPPEHVQVFIDAVHQKSQIYHHGR